MDKQLVLAVAGSGKTTFIVNNIDFNKRSLIITYSNTNRDNLIRKIYERNNGLFPESVIVMTYFTFLYSFCYKPFLSDKFRAKGINYSEIDGSRRFLSQDDPRYYFDDYRRIYNRRLSLLIDKSGQIEDVKQRIKKYFDFFAIDEIQDIGARDFNFLKDIMKTNLDMLFVGDFYQHTYTTSHDGNVNKNLFEDIQKYIKHFTDKGFIINYQLQKSFRCQQKTCDFVRNKLGIEIYSDKCDESYIDIVTDEKKAKMIINDDDIVKLHYDKSNLYGSNHKNWGDVKGDDKYTDVCVIISDSIYKNLFCCTNPKFANNTRNKLYVAITRSRRNVYFIHQKLFDSILKTNI